MSKNNVNFSQEENQNTQKEQEISQAQENELQTKGQDLPESSEQALSAEEEIAGLSLKIAELEVALAASEQTIKDQKDSVVYAKAEVQTIRNRAEKDVENAKKFALDKFASELLPVIDNLERAIEVADKDNEELKSMLEGVELTLKTMKSTVEKFGLTEVNPVGETFNPELHQAMSIQESADHAPNTVMLVMQKGYALNGRIVRPAMVMVSKAAS